MADHLHPAIDIPGGGLWEGACVRRDGSAFGVVIDDDSVEGDVLCALTHASSDRLRLYWIDVTDLSLRLDDPLGLGLAGLAGRVAERLDGAAPRLAKVSAVVADLAHYPWALPQWCDAWLHDRYADYPRVIREAATLLARLDRLVAAAWPEEGVQCLPGTVPDWRRDGAEWVLTVEPVGSARFALTTPDPLAALGAALEVCGG